MNRVEPPLHWFLCSKAFPEAIQMCKTNRSGKSAVLSKQQLERVMGQLPEKYSLLAEVMYWSSGRVKEITTLRVRNINFTDCLLTIEKASTKTKETRQVPLHPSTCQHLKEWVQHWGLKDSDYIFFTDSRNTDYSTGEKCIATQSVDQFFRKTFDWLGIDGASTHSFRRSRLTHLHINEGWSLAEIKDISGHKTLTALQQYLDTDKKKTFEKYRSLMATESI